MSYRGSNSRNGASKPRNSQNQHSRSPAPTSGSWRTQQPPRKNQGQPQRQQDMSASSSKFENPGFSYNGNTWVPRDFEIPLEVSHWDESAPWQQPQDQVHPPPQNPGPSGQNKKSKPVNIITIGNEDVNTTLYTKDEMDHYLQGRLSQIHDFIAKTEKQLRSLRKGIDEKTHSIAIAGKQMAEILQYLGMLEKNELPVKSESEGSSGMRRWASPATNIQPATYQNPAPVNEYSKMQFPPQQMALSPMHQQVPQSSYDQWNPAFENTQHEYYPVPSHVFENGGYYDTCQQCALIEMQQQALHQNNFPIGPNWTRADINTNQNNSQNVRIHYEQPLPSFPPGMIVSNNGYRKSDHERVAPDQIHIARTIPNATNQNLANGRSLNNANGNTASNVCLPRIDKVPDSKIQPALRIEIGSSETAPESDAIANGTHTTKVTAAAAPNNTQLQPPRIIETPPTPVNRVNPIIMAGRMAEERAMERNIEQVVEDPAMIINTETETETGTESEKIDARRSESRPEKPDAMATNVHLSSPQIIETPPTPITKENPEPQAFSAPVTNTDRFTNDGATSKEKLAPETKQEAEPEVGTSSDGLGVSAMGATDSSEETLNKKSQRKRESAKKSKIDAIEKLVSESEREMKVVKSKLRIRIQYYLNYQRKFRDSMIEERDAGNDSDEGTSISIEDMVYWIIERYEEGNFRPSNTIEKYLENERSTPSLENFDANSQSQMRKLFFIALSEMRYDKNFKLTIDEDITYLSLEKEAFKADDYFKDVVNYMTAIHWHQQINEHMKKHAECRRKDRIPQGSHEIEKELHVAFNKNIVTPFFYADSKFFKYRMQHHKDYQKQHPEVAEFGVYYDILDDRRMIREFERNIHVLNFDFWWLSTLEVELSPEAFDAKERQYFRMFFL